MATTVPETKVPATTAPATTGEETRTLINYRVEDGVAVIEMNDPPANTYTYEMNRQMDDAILKAWTTAFT